MNDDESGGSTEMIGSRAGDAHPPREISDFERSVVVDLEDRDSVK